MEKKPSKIIAVLFAMLLVIIFLAVITVGQGVVLFPVMWELAQSGAVTTQEEIMAAINSKEGLMSNAQFLSEVIAIIVMFAWYYFSYVRKDKREGTYKPITKKFENKYNLLFVVLLCLAASCSTFVTYSILEVVMPEKVSQLGDALGAISGTWIGVLAVAIGAPISEELAMRGILIRKSRKAFGVVGCMILSGLCFGMVHANIVQGIYAFPMGMIFGYVAYKFNSVIPTIIAHAYHNGLAGYVYAAIGKVGMAVALVLCCVAIYFVYKKVEIESISGVIKPDVEKEAEDVIAV